MTDDPIEAAKRHVLNVQQTPERLLDAANASLDAAASLGLPAANPARGVEHDAKKHLARIERVLHQERQANRELRKAVVVYGRRMTRLFRVVIALGLLSALVGGTIASQQRSSQVEACERDNRTRQSLRTIIARGDRNLVALYRDGTINAEQYRRAMRSSRAARRDLNDTNCDIPIRLLP